MKKSELLARIVALENRVTILQAQIAMQRTPAPVIPWTAPYPNHPPYVSPSTNPAPPGWLSPWAIPPVTICETTRAQ